MTYYYTIYKWQHIFLYQKRTAALHFNANASTNGDKWTIQLVVTTKIRKMSQLSGVYRCTCDCVHSCVKEFYDLSCRNSLPSPFLLRNILFLIASSDLNTSNSSFYEASNEKTRTWRVAKILDSQNSIQS